jgi:hypothetical protein
MADAGLTASEAVPEALGSPHRRSGVTFSDATVATTPTRRHVRADEARQVSSRFQTHVEMAMLRSAHRPSWRSRVYNAGPESHEIAHQEEGTVKSMKVFKGEVKDILHGIFLVLLLRFLVVLAVVLCALGGAAALVLVAKDPGMPLLRYVVFWSAA